MQSPIDARLLEPLAAPPRRPTLILPLPQAPTAFATLADLAAHVHRARAGRGLQARRAVGCWARTVTVPMLNLVAFDLDTGDEEWLGAALLVHHTRDELEAALDLANGVRDRRWAA